MPTWSAFELYLGLGIFLLDAFLIALAVWRSQGVERTLAWLHRFRRLAVRYERRPCVHEAFLSLACSLICWYYLKPVI